MISLGSGRRVSNSREGSWSQEEEAMGSQLWSAHQEARAGCVMEAVESQGGSKALLCPSDPIGEGDKGSAASPGQRPQEEAGRLIWRRHHSALGWGSWHGQESAVHPQGNEDEENCPSLGNDIGICGSGVSGAVMERRARRLRKWGSPVLLR